MSNGIAEPLTSATATWKFLPSLLQFPSSHKHRTIVVPFRPPPQPGWDFHWAPPTLNSCSTLKWTFQRLQRWKCAVPFVDGTIPTRTVFPAWSSASISSLQRCRIPPKRGVKAVGPPPRHPRLRGTTLQVFRARFRRQDRSGRFSADDPLEFSDSKQPRAGKSWVAAIQCQRRQIQPDKKFRITGKWTPARITPAR